jgi:hypothetical protein
MLTEFGYRQRESKQLQGDRFPAGVAVLCRLEAGSLKVNTALEYSTRVVQEGGRRCKKSTLNDLVHL